MQSLTGVSEKIRTCDFDFSLSLYLSFSLSYMQADTQIAHKYAHT